MNIKEEVKRELRVEMKIIGNKVIEKTIDLTLAEVKKVLRNNYIKCWECFNEAKTIEKQSAFSQRMDEILLNYSNIFDVSVNESKKELLDAEENSNRGLDE